MRRVPWFGEQGNALQIWRVGANILRAHSRPRFGPLASMSPKGEHPLDIEGRGKIPPAAEQTVFRRNMMSELNTKLPQAGSPNTGNPAAGSDRVQAPVASVGHTDFGGGQTSLESMTQDLTPRVSVTLMDYVAAAKHQPANAARARTTGHARIASLTAEVEARKVGISKPGEEDNIASLRELIKESEQKAEARLAEMRSLLKNMMEATKKQPNVNKTIKEGLLILVEHLEELEQLRRPLQKVQNILERSKAPTSEATNAAATSKPPRPRGGQKRIAASPPVPPTPETVKKGRTGASPSEAVEEGWMRVENPRKEKKKGKKKNKKKKMEEKSDGKEKKGVVQSVGNPFPPRKRGRSVKTKPDAIILRPAVGQTYVDALSSVRKIVQPEICGVEVKRVRSTRAGDVLVELRKTTAEARSSFSEALRAVAGDGSDIRELVPKSSLEISDLDSCSTKEEVEEALHHALGEHRGPLHVRLTRPNARQQVAAIVIIDETGAKALLKTARVKIGWVNCRIRRRVDVPRCFRCLGYGHHGHRCTGPDRSKACYRCGVGEHKAADCKNSPRCFLCAEVEGKLESCRHIAGSGLCGVFRKALARAKG